MAFEKMSMQTLPSDSIIFSEGLTLRRDNAKKSTGGIKERNWLLRLLRRLFVTEDEKRRKLFVERQETTQVSLKRASFIHVLFMVLFSMLVEDPAMLLVVLSIQNLFNAGAIFFFSTKDYATEKREIISFGRLLITIVCTIILQCRYLSIVKISLTIEHFSLLRTIIPCVGYSLLWNSGSVKHVLL